MVAKRTFLVIVLAYVGWLAFAYEYHFLDGVNLLFHEAGHLFLSFLGPTLHFLGGTIGQLFFPVACAVHFLQAGKHFEAWLMGVWLAESLMNTARYLGDAEAQSLPLIGGHIHDWNWLLTRWGVLSSCESIAISLHLSAVGLAVACVFAAWRSTDSFDSLSTNSSPTIEPGH
ncbi:MAG: hypothetical protein CL908_22590 [Deltaproteobacteria bacterium]|nr:hypothetical protein [Deltaproteobacteria bacterium]